MFHLFKVNGPHWMHVSNFLAQFILGNRSALPGYNPGKSEPCFANSYQRLPNLNTGVPLDVIFIAENIFDGTPAGTTAGCGCNGKREDVTLPVSLGTCSAAAVFGPAGQQLGTDAAGFGSTAQQFGADAAGFIWPAQQPGTGAAA